MGQPTFGRGGLWSPHLLLLDSLCVFDPVGLHRLSLRLSVFPCSPRLLSSASVVVGLVRVMGTLGGGRAGGKSGCTVTVRDHFGQRTAKGESNLVSRRGKTVEFRCELLILRV